MLRLGPMAVPNQRFEEEQGHQSESGRLGRERRHPDRPDRTADVEQCSGQSSRRLDQTADGHFR